MMVSGRLLRRPITGLLTLLALTHAVTGDTTRGPLQFCQNEMLAASCGEDEVVVMTKALYGRMSVSRCVDRDYGYVGCETSALHQSDAFCSGRRKCEINVPNSEFDQLAPCPNDLKSYFEAEYKCLKVETGRGQPCRDSSRITLTSASGYIASAETRDSGRGSARCPWLIQAAPGQRINVTLYDFATQPHRTDVCQAYASIRQLQPVRTKTVCAGTERVQHVYTSASHALEVRVMPGISAEKDKYFLLKYEVLGCPDLEAPKNARVIEDRGNSVELGCLTSDYTWVMTCQGTTWSGSGVNNCSDPTNGSVFGRMPWDSSQLPFGASLFVIFAIALALGILILVAGLVILRCRRRPRQATPREEHVYQSTKLPPGMQNRQLPPVMATDNDSLYQSSENEYSYIADVPAVQASPGKAVSYPPGRTVDLYQSRKCHDYGTTRHKLVPAPPLPPAHGEHTRGQQRECARYVPDPQVPELPTYFVLDTDQAPPVSVDAAPMPLRPNHNNNTTSSFNQRGPSSSKSKFESESLPKKANQSVHEFTSTYDHMDPNINHKSV